MNLKTRIVTENVAELGRFYERVLQLEPSGVEDYIEFCTEDGTLAITSQQKVNRHFAGAAKAKANAGSILDVCVADVDAEFERLRPVVNDFVLEPTTQPWGNRSMVFRDPDGNAICFYAPLSPE